MLRLLALALLLAPLAQAQSPCPSDQEPQSFHEIANSEPFAVWGDLAGFGDGHSPRVCTTEADLPNEDPDAPALFHALSDEPDGGLFLDAIVEREGRPVPFALVMVTTRDERDGPIQVAAVGVADREGAITMTLPASRNAVRLSISGGADGPPSPASVRDLLERRGEDGASIFARQSGDSIDLLFVAGPDSGGHQASYALRRYKNKHKKVQLNKELRSRKHFI